MVSQNHQLRQRNSKFHSRAGAVYFLFRRQPHFISNFAHLSRKGPIGEKFAMVCNQRSVWKIPTWQKWKYQTYSNCSEFTLIKNGMGLQRSQHFGGTNLWGKYRYIWIYENVLKQVIFENTEEGFFGKRDIYFFVGKYPSISSLVSPSRLAKCLELHWGQEPIFNFLEIEKTCEENTNIYVFL